MNWTWLLLLTYVSENESDPEFYVSQIFSVNTIQYSFEVYFILLSQNWEKTQHPVGCETCYCEMNFYASQQEKLVSDRTRYYNAYGMESRI